MQSHSDLTQSTPAIYSPSQINLMSKDAIREPLRLVGVRLSFDEFKGADINDLRALLIKKQPKTLPQLVKGRIKVRKTLEQA